MTALSFAPNAHEIGVQVSGFEPADASDPDVRDALADAFQRHGLLVFRDLDLDVDRQLELASAFGEPVIREKNAAPDAKRRTQHVSNALADGVFGVGELDFHLDQLFWEEPLKALMLYGLEIPSKGGDTKFVDGDRAYARMPTSLKRRIDDVSCRHAYTFSGALAKEWHVKDAETQDMSVVHPIVWRGEPGGRLGVWVNKMTTVGVEGMSEAEGAALIEEIRACLYDDEITYVHRWRAGDLVLWNNRTFQHARTPFDETERRTLRRTTLL